MMTQRNAHSVYINLAKNIADKVDNILTRNTKIIRNALDAFMLDLVSEPFDLTCRPVIKQIFHIDNSNTDESSHSQVKPLYLQHPEN